MNGQYLTWNQKKQNPIKTGSTRRRFPVVGNREESQVLMYPAK